MAISEQEQQLQHEAREALLKSITKSAASTQVAEALRNLAEAYAIVVSVSPGEEQPTVVPQFGSPLKGRR